MANVEINDIALKGTPVGTDECELQETGGGTSKKFTLQSLWDNMDTARVPIHIHDSTGSVLTSSTSETEMFTTTIAHEDFDANTLVIIRLESTVSESTTGGTSTWRIKINGSTEITEAFGTSSSNTGHYSMELRFSNMDAGETANLLAVQIGRSANHVAPNLANRIDKIGKVITAINTTTTDVTISVSMQHTLTTTTTDLQDTLVQIFQT